MAGSHLFRTILGAAFVATTGTTALGQYAWFSRNTDTILVSGQTELSNQCTMEVVFMLPRSEHSGGSILDEWALELEEKNLSASANSVGGLAFPNDYLEVSKKGGLLSLGEWHHLAFVCNGTEARLYLDGDRIQSGPAFNPIGNAAGPTFIGYAPRDGSDLPSFVGFIDSIRISGVARYTGLSFSPPKGDLPSDPDTLLLYNFNDPTNSPTVADESPQHRTGTLGTGFDRATAPKLISKLPADTPVNVEAFTAVEVRFPTSKNVQYQLQSSSDMAVWNDLPEIFDGDGGPMTKFVSTHETGRRFYRVVARP